MVSPAALALVLVLSAPAWVAAYLETADTSGGRLHGFVQRPREGNLQGVLITLEGILRGKPWPGRVARMTFEPGRLAPQLLVARTGQEIEFANHSQRLHTVRALELGETLFHVALPRGFGPVKKSFESPGLIEVRCELHDWEEAWIAVLDHPYFGITGPDGGYEIGEIPSGTYRVSAWHPRLGRASRFVTVPGPITMQMSLEFRE